MSADKNPNDYYPSRSKWVRAMYAIVVLIGYGFSEALLWILTVIQFLSVVFKGEPNSYICDFSDGLVKWNSSAISFCLWNNDRPPFPFSRWPDGQN